jgi:hypothetical protein
LALELQETKVVAPIVGFTNAPHTSTSVIRASPRAPNIFFPKHGVLQLLKNIGMNKEDYLQEFIIIRF